MSIRKVAATVFLLAVLSGNAYAWNYKGHEVVGAIADALLEPNAKEQVKAILGFTLKVAGPWADCARSVARFEDGTFKYAPSDPKFRIACPSFETPVETARMEDYVSRNWSNCIYQPKHGCDEAYHFTDVAIQHGEYSHSYKGTSEHDVVGAINAAIAVLKGQPAPLPFSIRDKKEALFLLAHFVGDLHQPLHVGAIYLDRSGQPVNPDLSGLDPSTETAGGNLIRDRYRDHDNDRDEPQHSEWDEIPDDVGDGANADMIRRARLVPPSTEPVEDFAAIWASDSMRAAHKAFAGLTFTGTDRNQWLVHFRDRTAYWKSQDELKREQLAKGGARLAQLLNAIWPSPAAAPPVEKVTACTVINVCYCITATHRDAITANVARIRQLIADQRRAGKAIGYLSIPLSTVGGGYMGVNREVAQQTKDRIERRFGAGSVWVLNTGAEANLPAGASGPDYMYMWTQILEGRGGFGEDFDFFYFTGPADFARFFGLTGTGDADKISAYFDQRVATDPELMSAVAAHKLSKTGFRNYYALRASVAFSVGSHDEWNISHMLNERRRGSGDFGIGNQIAIMFDGHGVAPGGFEGAVADGNAGPCK
jgi:hypothetical protein